MEKHSLDYHHPLIKISSNTNHIILITKTQQSMKAIINRYQRYKTLEMILVEHSESYKNIPDVVQMTEQFSVELNHISELISTLSRPISTIYKPRQDVRRRFAAELKSMISLILHQAVMTENQPIIRLMFEYRSYQHSAPAHRLYEIGLHITELLASALESLQGLGFTQEQLDSFNEGLTLYNRALLDADFQLNTRKTAWAELKESLKECSLLVKGRIDSFIIHSSERFPELHLEYMQARFRRKSGRNKNDENIGTSDITGTITDQSNNEPLSGATINLIELDHVVTSDEDGFFIFDELPAGKYSVSCHSSGYEVPEIIQITIADKESLVVNFVLQPVEGVKAA